MEKSNEYDLALGVLKSQDKKKKKRVIGKIKDWQESNWAQPAQVGKSQGLIVTNLITF